MKIPGTYMTVRQALIIFVVFFVLGWCTAEVAQADCYSDGIRSGTVQKFSKKGFVIKSWEGELVMDGIKSRQSGGITNVWRFSAEDPAVAKQIEDAMMSGKEVSLKYCQKMFKMGSTDTNYVITQVAVH